MADQLSLHAVTEPTSVLLSLQPQYMREIREGTKQYEYRRKYRSEPTRAFIYENAPVGAVTAVLELDEPIIAPPAEIARIADEARAGHGESVLDYMRGLDVGYAVPIRAWQDIIPVGQQELRSVHPRFTAPQSYVLLDRSPAVRDLIMERWLRGCR